MKREDINMVLLKEIIKQLSTLSNIFTFKNMISLIPELVACAIKSGMDIQKAYMEE